MKIHLSLFILAGFLILSSNSIAQKNKDNRVVIKTMINCEKCAEIIEEELDDVSGIKTIEIDLDEHKVIISYDSYHVNPERIREAISDAGFKADDIDADEDAYKLLPDCCKKPEDQQGQRSDDVDEKIIEIDED